MPISKTICITPAGARLTYRRNFIAVQQRVRLRDIRHVAGRADQGVHEARRRVHTKVRFEPEVPVVPLIGMVQFRVSFAVFVLGRRRRRDARLVAAL